MSKQFRIILGRLDRKYPNFPRSVPWELVEPGREQAYKNHSQTLERLNERGGLCCSEVRAALEGKELRFSMTDQEIEDDMKWLLQKLQGREKP